MRLTFTGMTLGLAMAAAAILPQPAAGAILVDQIHPYANTIGGGGDWDTFTTKLAATTPGYTIGAISNAAQVAAADAIIVSYRSEGPLLSSAEIANLTAFLATGKRVLMIAEASFSFLKDWADNIVDFASGGTATVTGGFTSGATAPAVANALTQGIASLNMQGVGEVVGGDGVSLFGTNFATLWDGNLLTVLDSQVFSNFGAPQFRDNVVAWLAASQPVPEPASVALLLVGVAGLAGAAKRRRA